MARAVEAASSQPLMARMSSPVVSPGVAALHRSEETGGRRDASDVAFFGGGEGKGRRAIGPGFLKILGMHPCPGQ
jgi:hypothetical protein